MTNSNSGPSDPTADLSASAADAATVMGSSTAVAGSLREGPGTRIGPYKILQLIGEGGFGSVFMAQQEQPVRRKVALKIIKLGMDTRQVVARFEQERQALAILDHPNIAKVFDAGATETGRPYFVMELCTGEPIDAYCDRHNLSIHERLELFAQVCTAVQHAHTKGIIHRDIKPSNVLVSAQDGGPSAKVIDFGIAKATASRLAEKTVFTEHQQIIGTPEYMSPEQAEGSLDIDTRTDVYALGVMLYELLTGSVPFSSRELRSAAYAEIQRIIREVDPPKPSTRLSQNTETIAGVAARRKTEPRKLGTIVRGELDWIVMKALEKDRTRRYESANGLAADIRRYLCGEAVVAAPPSTAYRFRKFIRRNRVVVSAGSAVALALLIGVVAFAWQAKAANDQRDIAVKAQASERIAKQQVEKRLGQIVKANEIMTSVFKDLNPQEVAQSGRPLQELLVEHLDQAAGELDGDAVGDPLVVAGMQMDLGAALQGLGEAGKAVRLLEKARDTFAATMGVDHTQTLTAMNDLAMACFDAGEVDRARTLMSDTLARRKSVSGLSHRETITCMNNLALIYQKAGEAAEAVKLLEEALELRTSLDGPEHPETANAMHNLALALDTAGESERALPLVQEALRIRRAKLGEDHPYTLLSVKLLASCHLKLGRPQEAITLLADAMARAKKSLGPGHPITTSIATSLTALYYQTQDREKLQALLEELLPSMKARLGADHPDTLNAMGNLAGVYWLNRQLDKSIPLFEETVRGYERTLGRTAPATVQAIANLGVNYASANRFEQATPLLEETYRVSRDSPDLAFATPALLDCYAAQGNSERAAAVVEDVLAYMRRATPPDSPGRAGAMAKTAEVLLRIKLFAHAEPLLREALTIREGKEPDDWRTFNTKSMLGGALVGQNKLTDAEGLLLDGYKGMKEREAAIPAQIKAARLSEALARLVRLYEAKGDATEAAAWRGRLESAKGEAEGGK
ncbi:MAG: serine/threonine protein kinase [Planctomycetes bacterium]|nr:serine/threonine protein kinase [Planctomycetota bacterium]